MPRLMTLLAATGLLSSGCADVAPAPAPIAGDATGAVELAPAEDKSRVSEIVMCRDRDKAADRAASVRTRVALAEMTERAAAGADPAADARNAAREGRFDLIHSISLGSFGPIGLNCRVPWQNPYGTRHPLHLASRPHSDLIVRCPDGGIAPEECGRYRDLDIYARAYNLALAGDPRFPYPDLCLPLARGEAQAPPFSLRTPEMLIAATTETDAPRNLGEAARRGPTAALDALIAAQPGAVDRPDDFGLTPLAWAVVRDRREAVDRLLKAGASPLRQPCDKLWTASPLRLAIVLGRTRIAARLMDTPEVKAQRAWPYAILAAAVRGGDAALLRRMLAEPHEATDAYNLRVAADNRPTPAVEQVIAGWERAARPVHEPDAD